MAGYNDTKNLITKALLDRPVGTEIQPEDQQAYALNMLDYIKSIELISTSTLIGVADENTFPVQSNEGKACYIAGIGQDRTIVFNNFIDNTGNPISITTGEMQGVFVILFWNTEYWTAYSFDTNIISNTENINFNIKKTYTSVSNMNSDINNPIGIDGKTIKTGDLVSVVNISDSSENAIYSKGIDKWILQPLSSISSGGGSEYIIFELLSVIDDKLTINYDSNPNAKVELSSTINECALDITNCPEGGHGKILVFQPGHIQLSFTDGIVGNTNIPQNEDTSAILDYVKTKGVIYVTCNEIIGDIIYTPPVAITDANYDYVDNKSCSLTWTAPKGNQFNNSVSFYDIRYSSTPLDEITDAIWSSLAILKNFIPPLPPDEEESHFFSDLPANTDMYIYIKSCRINNGKKYYSDISNLIKLKTLGAESDEVAYRFNIDTSGIYPQYNRTAYDSDLNVFTKINNLVDEQDKLVLLDTGYPDETNKEFQTQYKPYPYDRVNSDYTIIFDLFKYIDLTDIYIFFISTAFIKIYGLSTLTADWVEIGSITSSFRNWFKVSIEKTKFRYIKFVYDDGDTIADDILGDNDEGILDNHMNPNIGGISEVLFYGKANTVVPENYKPIKRRLIAKKTVDEFFCVNGHAYQPGRIHSMCSGSKVRLYIPPDRFTSNDSHETFDSVESYKFNVSEIAWVKGNNDKGENLETMLKDTYKKYGLKPYITFSNTNTIYQYFDKMLRPLDNYLYDGMWKALPSKTKGFTDYYAVTFNPDSYKTMAKNIYALAAKYGSNNSIDGSKFFCSDTTNMNTGLDLISGIEFQNEPDQSWNDWHGYERPEEYAAITSACTDGNVSALADSSEENYFGVKNADENLLAIGGGLATSSPEYIYQANLQSQRIRSDNSIASQIISVHNYISSIGGQHTGDIATISYAIPPENNLDCAVIDYRDKFAQNKEVWMSEFGYGESGGRNKKCNFQCFSLPGKVIGDWTIPDIHRADVKGNYIIRGTLFMMSKGFDLMNYYSTECESNFFDTGQWGAGAGDEMFHWNDETSTEPGAKYAAIEKYECTEDRGGFASMGLFGAFLANGAYPISRAYWRVATMRNRLKGYILIGTKKSTLNDKILIYCFKKKDEDKGAIVTVYNDEVNTGIANVAISVPEEASVVTKINFYVPEIPNPMNVPVSLGIDDSRTGLPTAKKYEYINGEWNEIEAYGCTTAQEPVFPSSPNEGDIYFLQPTAEENPYYPIVGPVCAVATSNEMLLQAQHTEYFNSETGNWDVHGNSKLAWRQVDAVCDYIEYTEEGKKGTMGTEEIITPSNNSIIVNVGETPTFYLFEGVPDFDYESTVSDLATIVKSTTSLNLYWNNNSSEDTAYKIFTASLPNAEYTLLKTVVAGNENKTYIDGLSPNTVYYFKIKPINGTKEGTLSDFTSGKTFLNVDIVSGLISENPSVDKVTLSWNYAAEALEEFIEYAIYRDDINGIFTKIDSVKDQNIKTYEDKTIVAGQTYSYKIQVVTNNGVSDYSDISTIITGTPSVFRPAPSSVDIIEDGTKIKLIFTQEIIGSDYTSGFSITKDGTAVNILTGTLSTDNKELTLTTDEVLYTGVDEDLKVIILNYDSTIGNITALSSDLSILDIVNQDISKKLEPSIKTAASIFNWVSLGLVGNQPTSFSNYDEEAKISRGTVNKYHPGNIILTSDKGTEVGTLVVNEFTNCNMGPHTYFGIDFSTWSNVNDTKCGAISGDNSWDYPDVYMEANAAADKYKDDLSITVTLNTAGIYKVRIFSSTKDINSAGKFCYVLNAGLDNEEIIDVHTPEGWTPTDNKTQWLEFTTPFISTFNIVSVKDSETTTFPLNIVEIISID